MAKRKRVNRRVVLLISVFGVLLIAGLMYVYIMNLPQDPAQYIKKADEALAKDPKDYKAAHRALNKAILAGGDSPDVEHYLKLAELCFERYQNDLELTQSEKVAIYGQGIGLLSTKALVQDPTFNKARRLLASHWWSRALRFDTWEVWQDYIAEVDRILKIDKDDAQLYYQRGYAKSRLARIDPTYNKKALVDFQEAVNIDEKNQEFWDALTTFLVFIEKYDEAEEAYKQAITANPNKARLRLNYSIFLRNREREDEALELIRDAIQCEPDNPAGYIYLAKDHMLKKQLDEAEKALQQAQKIDKTDVNIYTHYADIFRKRKDMEGAIKSLQEGLKTLEQKGDESAVLRARLFRSQATLNYWLADIMLDIYVSTKEDEAKAQTLAQVRRYYEKLAKLSSMSWRRYRIAGRLAVIDNKLKEAREFFEKAQKRNFNLNTAVSLVHVYNRLGIPSRGEALVNKILKRPELTQDQTKHFLLQRAKFRMNAGYYDEARKMAERAQKIDPESKEAARIIYALDIAEGKTSEPSEDTDDNILVRFVMNRQVEEHILNNQLGQAEEILEIILAKNPKDNVALSKLLMLLVQTEQKDKAIDLVEQYLKDDPENQKLQRFLRLLQEPNRQKQFKIEMEFTDMESDPLKKALMKWNVSQRYGQLGEAMKYLHQAEKIDPQNGVVMEGLFSNAMRTQNWKLAEDLIGRFKEEHRARRELNEARLKMARGQFEKAIPHLQAALREKSHLQYPRLLLGQCYEMTQEWEKSKEEYLQCLENNSQSIPAMIGLAKLADRKKDSEQHKEWILKAYHYPVGKRDPYVRDRFFLIMESDPEFVQAIIQKREGLLKSEPDDLTNAMRLATLYEKNKQLQKALQIIENVYQRTSNKIEVASILATFYKKMGRSSLADELFAQLEKKAKNPEQKVAVLVAYANFLSSFDAVAAGRMYEKAIAVDKSGTRGLRSLANFYALQAQQLARQNKKQQSQAKWKEAIKLTKKALDRKPDDTNAQMILYRMYIEADMLTEAITGLKKLLVKNPSDTQAHIGLGLGYLRSHKLDEAEMQFNRAIEIDPNSPEAYIFRSRVYQAWFELDKAAADLEVATKFSNNIVLSMDLGNLYEAMGKNEAAAQEYDKILVKSPKYLPAYNRLLHLFIRLRKWSVLERLAREGMGQFPQNPLFPMSLAQAAKEQGQTDEQIRMLASASKAAPESLSIVRRYFLALLEAERYDKLLAESQKYLNRPVHKDGVLTIRAMIAAKRNPKANEPFQQILAILKDTTASADVPFICGMIKDTYGIEKLAAESADIIKARPKDWRIYAILGDAYRELKRYPQSEEAYIKARGMCDTLSQRLGVTRGLTRVYTEQKEYAKAEREYKVILKEEPNNVHSLNNLAYLYADNMDRHEEAIPLIERAMQLSPGNINLADTYAWALAKDGQFDRALLEMKKVIDKGEPRTDRLYHMGYLLEKTGDFEGAKEYYRRGFEPIRDDKNHPLYEVQEKALSRIEKKLSKE